MRKSSGSGLRPLPLWWSRPKGGDVGAARLLLERVLPPMKATEPPTAFALPDGTLSQQARAVVASVASGELAVGSGAQLLSGLGTLAKIIESDELAARITALETKNAHT